MKTLSIDQAILADLYEALFENFEHGVALSTIFERRRIEPGQGRSIAEQMQRDGLIKASSLVHHSITGLGVTSVESAHVVPETLAVRCEQVRRQILELAAAERREKGEHGRVDYDAILKAVSEQAAFVDVVIRLLLEMDWIRCPASRCFSITPTGMSRLGAAGY